MSVHSCSSHVVHDRRCCRCRQDFGDGFGDRQRSQASVRSCRVRDDPRGSGGDCASSRAPSSHRVPRSRWVLKRPGIITGRCWTMRWPAGLGGVGAQPGSRRRATPGGGSAAGQDRRDRSGGDHRAGVGRAGTTGRWPRRRLLGEIGAWAAHRSRRVAVRTATKNQLLGQLDRAFPGLTAALPDVLGTKIGRLIAAEFADPARLTALRGEPADSLCRRPRRPAAPAAGRTSGHRGARGVADR